MSSSTHCIKRHTPKWNAPTVLLEKARNGMWTASIRDNDAPPFYLHSRYDPVAESERFAATHLVSEEEEKPASIVLYGAGCGHHIKAILKQTEGDGIPIQVWETNVVAFLQLEQAGAFAEVIENPRLTFVVTDDMQIFSERVNAWRGGHVHVIVHEPSLRAMPVELEPLKTVLQDYQVKHNSVIAHRELLHDNFSQNNRKEWPSVSAFRELPSVPIILISAGPSLAQTLDLLPSAATHCLLGAVGTATYVLNNHGIKPDFVVMMDPKQGMLGQLEGWETAETPFFFMSTLHPDVIAQYQGSKFILFQQGFAPAERAALLREEPLVQTGGSVATTLFSLSRLLGGKPLCLVGQDLAYTNNQTHVKGTLLYEQWEQEAMGERVLAFDRKGTVVAPRNLLLYKKWFQQQARNSDEIFYNATEGGAYIEGFTHITLSEFLTKVQSVNVSETREIFHRLAKLAAVN